MQTDWTNGCRPKQFKVKSGEEHNLHMQLFSGARHIGSKLTTHDGNDMDISYTDHVTFDNVKPSDLEPPAAVKTKLAEIPKQ